MEKTFRKTKFWAFILFLDLFQSLQNTFYHLTLCLSVNATSLHYTPPSRIDEKFTRREIVVRHLFMFMKIDHLTHLRPHVAVLESTSLLTAIFLTETRVDKAERTTRKLIYKLRQQQQHEGKNFAVPSLRSWACHFLSVFEICWLVAPQIYLKVIFASIKESTPEILQRYYIFLWAKNKQGSDISLCWSLTLHHQR